MIIFGRRLYGKTDVVPGLFYVATWFAHVYFMPLIPLSSSVVLDNRKTTLNAMSGKYIVVPIKLSWKSVFLAFVRFVLFIVFVGGAVVFLFYAADALGVPMFDKGEVKIIAERSKYLDYSATLVLTSGILIYFSYRQAVASEDRALALAKMAGFSEMQVREHLSFDGYPLRRPQKAVRTMRCERCDNVFSVEAAHNSNVFHCPRCGARVTPFVKSLIIYLGIAALPITIFALVRLLLK